MYIISANVNDNGGYAPLQKWQYKTCPANYHFYPDEFVSIFYADDKRVSGFVKYEVDASNTVTSVEWNDEAYNAYIANLPDELVEAKKEKIAEMSKACNKTIEAGIDCEFDGVTKHYSLTNNDQTNISNMFNAVLIGATGYPYHADGEECAEMPKGDIIKLYTTVQSYITSQVTYNNMLKGQINDMNVVSDVEAVVYGTELTGDWATKYASEMAKAQAQMEKILQNLVNLAES